jgi:cytochrome c oxidase assembly factor CtaG
MVQHVALTMVAAPLLAAGLPRVARLVHPVVAWLLFAATGWLVHFTGLFEAATDHVPVHVVEHALLLGTAVLFWAQVVGRTRVSHPLRLLYLVVAMPQNTFLALAISSSGRVLYRHYAGGGDPLGDQRLGGGIMWVAGDVVLLVAVLLTAAAWARHEERENQLREAGEASGEPADPLPSPRTAG